MKIFDFTVKKYENHRFFERFLHISEDALKPVHILVYLVKPSSLKLVYYSPTGTSKRTIEAIAVGLEMEQVEHIDLTLPESEKIKHEFAVDDLTIIAVPVYGGRIPFTAAKRLNNLITNGAPAVLVVVYGNRAYEDALLELKDLATKLGFKAVAGAAFIGEHSFDTVETPIDTDRPDQTDVKKAEEFDVKVKTKLEGLNGFSDLLVPSNKPYKERRSRKPRSLESDPEICIHCGMCARVCPTGVVTVSDVVETEKGGCTLCTACVKSCPTGARHWEDEGINRVAVWLHTNYAVRREPEFFL